MKVGSLFAGIGGFDLAAEWMGWRTVWMVENALYPAAVLRYRWPGVPVLGDIALVDFTQLEPVDLLCGGFPCQDISTAGKRAGIRGERSGLWSHFARAIGELRPRYVVVENVAALLTPGRGFDVVLGDLATLGYDAEWEVLSAADVGAPHLRERVWIVGYPADSGPRAALSDSLRDSLWELWEREREQPSEPGETQPRADGQRELLADSARPRNGRPRQRAEPNGSAGRGTHRLGAAAAEDEHTEPSSGGRPVRGGPPREAGQPSQLRPAVAHPNGGGRNAGKHRGPPRGSAPGGTQAEPEFRSEEVSDPGRSRLPESERQDLRGTGWREEGRAAPQRDWWAVEPDVGRVAHGVPARVDRLTGLGNAIVPKCALQIFQAIQTWEASR